MLYRSDEKQVKECRQTCKRVSDRKYFIPANDVEEKGKINIQQIPFLPKHDMREVRGTYMEVTALDFYKDMNTDDYLHITLTDEEDIPDAIGKLRCIYPNIMKLSYDNLRTRAAGTVRGTAEVEEKSPMELLREFYELQNNQPMTDEQEEIARGMMEEIRLEYY